MRMNRFALRLDMVKQHCCLWIVNLRLLSSISTEVPVTGRPGFTLEPGRGMDGNSLKMPRILIVILWFSVWKHGFWPTRVLCRIFLGRVFRRVLCPMLPILLRPSPKTPFFKPLRELHGPASPNDRMARESIPGCHRFAARYGIPVLG